MYLYNIQPIFKYRVSHKILLSYPNPWADLGIENIFFTIGARTDGLGKDCN